MNKLASGLAFAFAASLLILLFSVPLAAQKSKSEAPPAQPSTAPPSARGSSISGPDSATTGQTFYDVEYLLLRRTPYTEAERNRRRAAAQLYQDFRRLRQINAETISPFAGISPSDYKRLSRAIGELRDRAARIKYNIPFSIKHREQIRYEEDAMQLGSMLPQLSRVIESFLSNPALRMESPNDAELRAQAGRDLDGIIKLSKSINRLAKQLSKAGT